MLGVVGAVLLATGAPSQTGYYETPYVAVTAANWVDPFGTVTAGNDIAMFGIQETLQPAGTGRFLDFSTFSFVGQNSAAALDVNKAHSIAGRHNYTGYMGVAKALAQPPWGNYLEFWRLFNDATWTWRQDLGIQPVMWQIPTASGNSVSHMDVANGVGAGAVYVPRASQYITAEMLNNQLHLGAYILHDGAGNERLPVIWSAVNTSLPLGVTCIGLTVSNGLLTTSGPGAGARTTNIVFFVDSNMIVHAITYDVLTGAWGVLDALPSIFPFSLPGLGPQVGAVIAGIWPAQNQQFTHDIGISIPDKTNPLGATGTLFVINDLGTAYTYSTYQWGGGPLSHAPADMAARLIAPGASGWFVTVPGIIVGGYVVRGVQPNGGWFYFYGYPTGSTPNGIPLAHNGQAWNATMTNGFVWVPYLSSTNVPSLDLADGSAATLSTVTYSTAGELGAAVPAPGAGLAGAAVRAVRLQAAGILLVGEHVRVRLHEQQGRLRPVHSRGLSRKANG
jgi:hypothetical protein